MRWIFNLKKVFLVWNVHQTSWPLLILTKECFKKVNSRVLLTLFYYPSYNRFSWSWSEGVVDKAGNLAVETNGQQSLIYPENLHFQSAFRNGEGYLGCHHHVNLQYNSFLEKRTLQKHRIILCWSKIILRQNQTHTWSLSSTQASRHVDLSSKLTLHGNSFF
jgi:hypothetical protein